MKRLPQFSFSVVRMVRIMGRIMVRILVLGLIAFGWNLSVFAHEGEVDPDGTFAQIQHDLFNKSCSLQSCHTSALSAGGLNLEEGFAYANLVNVAPTNSAANGSGKLRVDPSDLDNSFLMKKLLAMLDPGEGAPMPLGSAGLISLRPDQVDLVGDWILAGAPEVGVVDGAGNGGGGFTANQPTVDPLPVPAAGQGFQVSIPAFALNDASELEGCLFVQLPNEEEIYMSGYEVAMRPGSHHFIVYQYNGEACEADDDNDGTPNCLDQDSADAFPPEFIEDVGCNDRGPEDRFRKALIAGSDAPTNQVAYPDGIALKLQPRQGLLLNAHYINFYSDTQGEVYVNLYTVPADQVQYEAKNLFDVVANSFIDVPPFSTKTTEWSWSPNSRIALLGLTSHMHKRGTLFTIDHLADDGTNLNPVEGPTDPDGNTHLYVNRDYVDPADLGFDPPLILEPGDRLVYTCHHDNGVERSIKLGCEETPGVAPGVPLGPAQACSIDDDCLGFGTEKCVPANLVFGFTSNDEMCIMPGLYYELEAQQTGDIAAFSIAQLTDTVGADNFSPSLSGDGTRLAFGSSADLIGSNADGSAEIFSADLSTTPPTIRQLTSGAAVITPSVFPVISDDGTTIVFTSNGDPLGTNTDGNVEVFAVDFDGSNLRQLTQTASGTNGPFFGATATGLSNTLGLAISGDGSTVAIVSNAPLGTHNGSSQEVFVVNSDGTNIQQLTTGTTTIDPTNDAISGVSIREDGAIVVFASTANYTGGNPLSTPQIFTAESDGTNLQQITTLNQISCPENSGTTCIASSVTPSFSDDGSRIGYLRLAINTDNVLAPELLNVLPFIMNDDGTGVRQLFTSESPTLNCTPPTLSQDGSRAVFSCTDSVIPEDRVYLNNAEGDSLIEVAGPVSGNGSLPVIDDSGVRIAFAARNDLVADVQAQSAQNAQTSKSNADGNVEIFLAELSASVVGAAFLENPSPGSTHAGIGVIGGWACDADRIDLVLDDTIILQAAYGTSRADTAGVCGDTHNGFGLLINWNLIGAGTHTLSARLDGMEFARTTFTVAALSDDEFMTGLSGQFTLNDFPSDGIDTIVHWEEGLQSFVLGVAGSGSGIFSGNGTQLLENPSLDSVHSGVGVISGWACDAGSITIEIDNTPFQAAYGTSRGDTAAVCGDTDNGFSLLINWNLLGHGTHTIRVLADGVEFASTTFTVVTLGSEFIAGLSGEYTLEDFPEAGINTIIRWEESAQNFIVVGTEEN